MTQKGYYKDALSTLKNGEKYLLDMIGEYPVRKTEDGIQPIIYVKSRIKSPESMMRKLWKKGETDADTALKKANDAVGVRVGSMSFWMRTTRRCIPIFEKRMPPC